MDESWSPRDLVAGLEADLVALAAADADLERDAEVAERTRIERSAITLLERLRGARGPVEVATRGGGRYAGRVTQTGEDWILVAHVPAGQGVVTAEHLVRIASVLVLRGLGRPHPARVSLPRSTAGMLRTWCRDRSDVAVQLVDGSVVSGLASAAYADHLEISTGGGESVVAPFEAIAAVSR